MNTPTKRALDLYIDEIVDRLREKYEYADKNRMLLSVKIHYRGILIDDEGFAVKTVLKLEIPYTELIEAMESNTLPTEIKKLL